MIRAIRQIPQARPDIGPEEVKAVQDVVASGVLSLGPRLGEFEAAFRQFLGVSHALAVSSGTAGLHLCMRAFEIGQGDEVITTPFSFVASANCIEYEGAIPRFVDIEPVTLNIDPAAIDAAINSRTRAILPVHVFGHPCDMEVIRDIARRRGLALIEDACEALGSSWRGHRTGTRGDAAVMAFYPNKQIATGEGGMVVTSDPHAASLIDSMRNQGRADDGGWLRHERLGFNYRLNEMSAALGVVQMRRLDAILASRARVASRYSELLCDVDGITLPEALEGADVAWFVYVVRLDPDLDRDRAMVLLAERGVQCRPYFPPIHLQPYYVRKYGYRHGEFPVCEAVAASTLSIPFHGQLDEADQETVRDCLVEVISLLRSGRGTACR